MKRSREKLTAVLAALLIGGYCLIGGSIVLRSHAPHETGTDTPESKMLRQMERGSPK